jgi:membrane dipeptidase
MSKAREIHKKSIVVDGLAAVYPKDFNEEYIQNLKKGGITAIHVTIPDVECFSLPQAVQELSVWFERLRRLEPYNVRLVTTVKEIRDAKEGGGVAVVLGSQGAGFLGLDLRSLEFFARLGMRTMQPTYQQRNQFGDGCGERTDTGLSNLGVQWVEEMNKIGMVISLSHAGYKTSMDVMEISKDPVIFDHSNPKALCEHPRNLKDDQIQACAEKDGVIGLCPLAMFVNADKGPDELGVEDFIVHVDYVAELVGVEHVGIGTDLAEGYYWTPEQILEKRRMFPKLTSKGARKVEDEFLKSGREKLYFYEVYMPWLKSTSEVPIITEALVKRGYSDKDVGKILGGNLLRVFEKVLGS